MPYSNKFGGAYKAVYTTSANAPNPNISYPLGSTAAGFLMGYTILHEPFGEDFFGRVATIGTILKGAEVTVTLVGLSFGMASNSNTSGTAPVTGGTANIAFSAIGGLANIGSPFNYVGRDGHDLAGQLVLTPFLTAYASNLPALTPTNVTFNYALPVGPVDVNLDSSLRIQGLFFMCLPDYNSGQIFTWT